MIVKTRWLWLSIGRDLLHDLPIGFSLCLFPDLSPRPPGLLIPCWLYIEAGWRWLPTLIREYHGGPLCLAGGAIDSANWTGRNWETVGWSWPFYIWVRRGKWPRLYLKSAP